MTPIDPDTERAKVRSAAHW